MGVELRFILPEERYYLCAMNSDSFSIPSPVEEVDFLPLKSRNIRLFIKRDDLIHPVVSGNKWRKLRLNIAQAQHAGHTGILTFGGAHSNHIAASAEAARSAGLEATGIIRGEDADLDNPTLKAAAAAGMKLEFVSREAYRYLQEYSAQAELAERFGRKYIIAQGGANFYGVQGCQDIIHELELEPDRIFVACGTATTLTGMAMANAGKAHLYGVSALKGGGFLRQIIEESLRQVYQDRETERFILEKIHLLLPYHFGGFARVTTELIDFMRRFTEETGIKLDPVYTAKAAYAMTDLAGQLNSHRPEKWLFIHTGGLQGLTGMEARLGYAIYPNC